MKKTRGKKSRATVPLKSGNFRGTGSKVGKRVGLRRLLAGCSIYQTSSQRKSDNMIETEQSHK